MRIHLITHLTITELRPLLDASLAEGYTFIQKLWDEYDMGAMTFCENGAGLLGITDETQLIGIGGVHTDPYLQIPTIGRIRHVYVLAAHRRKGIGKQLIEGLIAHAAPQFMILTLRTQTEEGRNFYTALGFSEEPRFENATHWLELKIR
ncbi:MAG: GNAT family N-acetyltransferase [Pleurocapsa minor GSE-CHR-MK-17-07R]|jgi:GNAT superfamily N-acetyltransferase|nr:GNAT family N-acetyltransferase [Pleurocapsa minor GSE-CHR-MK 17-07R]